MLSNARSQADSNFKLRFEKLSSELEENYQNKIQQIAEEYKKQLDEYKTSIKSTQTDISSFNSFLQKVLDEQ